MSAHFSAPRENVLQLGLREGMKVGDFGAGSGHYARAAAALVGYSGKVYAIDVQEDVLKHLKLNTHDHHHGIVETVWGDIEKAGGTHLKSESLDAAIVANVFFQIENRYGFLAELKRVLKKGGSPRSGSGQLRQSASEASKAGKLLVVDWAGSYGGMGPAPEKVVSEHEAEDFFIGGGFHKVKSFRAGPHHYGILFSSP